MSLHAFEIVVIALGTLMVPLLGLIIRALNRISTLETQCQHLEERNRERRGDMTRIYERLGSIEDTYTTRAAAVAVLKSVKGMKVVGG